MRFKDKVVVVTGSSRNLGFAIARRFGEEGAKVVINAASSADELADAEAKLKAQGIEVRAVLADTANEAEAQRLIATAVETWGRLDVLGLIHSTRPLVDFMDITTEAWHEAVGTNLHSNFYLCKAAVPHLVASGNAAIVATGGGAGRRGVISAHRAHAFAALAGKNAMLQVLAHELAPKGVRVNFVAPGVMDTFRKHPEWYPGSPPEGVQWTPSTLARIPMGRPGTVDELANAVLFLASDEASYIIGTTIEVNGGWSA